DAIEILEPLRARHPAEADVPRLLAHAFWGIGDLAKAREAAVRALSLGRLTSDTLGRIAQIDRERGDRTALLNAVRLLTITDAENFEWRVLYADMLASAGDLAEAASLYNELVEVAPTRGDLYARLGNVALRDDRLGDAVTALETAWQLGERSPALAGTIGAIWQRLDDQRRTLEWIEISLSLEKDPTPALRLQHARLALALGELALARKSAEILVATKDEETLAEAELVLGHVAMSENAPGVAAEHWERAVRAGATAPQLLSYLGGHFFNAGDPARAAKYLRRKVEGDEFDEQDLRFLVIALVRIGERDEARARLRLYLELYGLNDAARELIETWRRARS
ncbi:MAG TPA: tetratricopeptide repeat protein, partial [Planctomycetota bacterium]|nr:tetratricopeptide repeat protein [Planctomycetota bacterium]